MEGLRAEPPLPLHRVNSAALMHVEMAQPLVVGLKVSAPLLAQQVHGRDLMVVSTDEMTQQCR